MSFDRQIFQKLIEQKITIPLREIAFQQYLQIEDVNTSQQIVKQKKLNTEDTLPATVKVTSEPIFEGTRQNIFYNENFWLCHYDVEKFVQEYPKKYQLSNLSKDQIDFLKNSFVFKKFTYLIDLQRKYWKITTGL